MYANEPARMECANRYKLRNRHRGRLNSQTTAMVIHRPRPFSSGCSPCDLLPASDFCQKRLGRVSCMEFSDHSYASGTEFWTFSRIRLVDTPSQATPKHLT